MHQHFQLVLFSAVRSRRIDVVVVVHPSSLPPLTEIEIYSAETTGLGGRERALLFGIRATLRWSREPIHHPLYFSKVRAPSGIQMAEGGREIWNVLMADRLRRIRRSCLDFVSFEMRFHAGRVTFVCVCACFYSSIFFRFFRETGRATIVRPRRVFQFTLYRGQIAR